MLVLRLLSVVLVSLSAMSAASTRAVDFAHDVVPVLRVHCGKCHTGDAKQGGFSMNTRESLLAGGDSGVPGFVEGKANESEIIVRIASDDPDIRMPLEDGPLPAEAVAVLRQWIVAKAPWEDGFAFKGTGWEPPLQLRQIELAPAQDGRMNPIDRLVDDSWRQRGIDRPARCDDRTFIRRVSLDLVGLLPDVDRVASFVVDPSADKRKALVRELLADKIAYAEHWMTFWNDLLRNDYTGTGFITGGRRQITTWLHRSLVDNKPFDQFVRELIAPTDESRGFIDGIVWRGTVNASQTVPIQFAQNVGQTFLGINLKCASCHDSFVDRWTLQQTYDLAAILSEKPLELHRCDKATGSTATPAWLFAELGQVDVATPPAQRLEQLATLMTKPENGWLSRNLVNRLWCRLMGRGIVHPVDALRTRPWSEDLLDLLAGELVAGHWDMKQVLELICTSEAYGAATPTVDGQPQGIDFIFKGPLPRRMTAEQFTDAVWQLANTAPSIPDAEVVRFDLPPGSKPQEGVAVWIWSNELATSPPNEKLTFRKRFTLPHAPVNAAVVFAADNVATIFVNGRRVGMNEEWSRPVMELVASELKQGDNEIVLAAANGDAGGVAAAKVELRATLPDGSITTIATDDSWEWTVSAPASNGKITPDAAPADWAPAVVAKTQTTWAGSTKEFVRKLLYATASGPIPMVRSVLVKGTPLMAALGRPNRDQVITSRPNDLTTLEAIQLANEQGLADEFTKGATSILAKHGPGAAPIVRWLFSAALSREPTAAELAAGGEMLGETPTEESVADCLWAVVMLPEFQLIR